MKMNRREFVYAVGSTTAGIAGWLYLPGCKRVQLPRKYSATHYCPELAHDISLREVPDGGELMRQDERGAWYVVCHTNDCGLKVLKNLNGEHTIQSLAETIHEGFDPGKLEHTTASVASFLAMLAQAGLLAEPFFVNLHAVEMTA